jgi:hypothetical protein
MDQRRVTLEIVITPARGKTLMETEAALRRTVTQLGYVEEVTVTKSTGS